MTYTNSQIRAAILKTADLFAQRPDLYNYRRVSIPECGTPGCMLGYIAAHLGMATHGRVHGLQDVLGFHHDELYSFAMDWRAANAPGFPYTDHAHVAAGVLRAFADARFPAENAAPVVAADPSRALIPWSQCVWQPKALQVSS